MRANTQQAVAISLEGKTYAMAEFKSY